MCILQIVVGDRLKRKMYRNIHSYSSCIRLLNGTRQIGCNSARGGNVGVLHHVKEERDLAWLIDKGPHQPYIVLLTNNTFTKSVVSRLKLSGKVNGMLLVNINQTEKPTHFSPDKTCPNSDYGMYKKSAIANCHNISWNPQGSALMFVDFNIPIFLLHCQQDVDFLINKCYQRHNAPRENGDPSLSPHDYCSPLGDHNIYSFVHEPKKLEPDSVVVLSAKLDAFSMFEDIVPAGDSTVTGLVALLAVAEAIGKVKRHLSENDRPIVFILFNGESFDYIGSSSMLYQMRKNNLQHGFQLKHIYAWLELNQVGIGNQTWIHSDPLSRRYSKLDAQVTNLTDLLRSAAYDVGLAVDEAPSDQPLPPASIQTFLAENYFPGLVLTDHKANYSNKYYNSQYDTAAQLDINATVDHLTLLATTVAQTLIETATGIKHTAIQANVSTVRGLLHCFLTTPQCELFNRTMKEAENMDELSNTTYTFYLGSINTGQNALSMLAWHLMTYFLGDHNMTVSEDHCKALEKDKMFKYTWMQGEIVDEATQVRQGICVKGNVHYLEAVSPAFLVDDYDWQSRRYSTWSQSMWGHDAMLVRVFLLPSFKTEMLTLTLGISLFLLGLVIAIYIKQNASNIFPKVNNPI
ncbi:Nicastrin [Lamellibrachia satsuma]|nr:Nicastrin [Lamellibrachia satsuma]